MIGDYEKLYRLLLDSIPSSVLLIDRGLSVAAANRNFLEKSRRAAGDTVGKRLEEVFPPVIFDHMKLSQRVREVFDTQRATPGERMTYRAPGIPNRVYYYRMHAVSSEHVMLLMDDVTEQVRLAEDVRRVERHLAGVVDCASDLILSTDGEGRIVTWNPAAERITGYSFDEVRDQPFYQYLEGDDAKRALTSGARNGEWPLVKKDGTAIPVSWVLSPMTAGTVVIGRDLKLELELLQSQKLAALGVMAGGIAHEIRNPLAICSSAAQFLMQEKIDAPFRKECADKINRGIQRASTIIENLLKIARPSEGNVFEVSDLRKIVEETLPLVSNQAKIQQVEISLSLPAEPAAIRAVPGLVQQVLFNLFVNAIRAMPSGGTLGIQVARANGEVSVQVRDTGCGIAPEHVDRIFDPFFTTAPAGQGTGLGLSVSYAIVKQHSGVIDVESRVGAGSTFNVRFPACEAARAR